VTAALKAHDLLIEAFPEASVGVADSEPDHH
jgi:hypothetical protein